MTFGEQVDYERESTLTFRSDAERILRITDMVSLPVGQDYVTLQDATEFPVRPLI